MNSQPIPTAGQLVLVLETAETTDLIHAAIAQLALSGRIHVIDGGNRFDPYRITRQVRAQTADLGAVLGRVHYARAFTCYQLVTLLDQTPTTTEPHIILDLLSTFVDENIPLNEAHRLLELVIANLGRLSHAAPVLITVRHPERRPTLLNQLCQYADQVITPAEVEQKRKGGDKGGQIPLNLT